MSNRRKLRNYLIDPSLQFRFAGYTLLIFVVFALSVGVFSSVFLSYLTEHVAGLSEGSGSAATLLQSEIDVFFDRLVVMLILFLIIAGAYIILQTHKIAGAEFAIVRHISTKLQQMDFEGRLTLRRADYLTGIARELNLLAEKLKSRQAGSS